MPEGKRPWARRVTLSVAALLVILLAIAGLSYRKIHHWVRWGSPEPLAPDLDRILWWFPEDTQTLMAVRDGAKDVPKQWLPMSLLRIVPHETIPLSVLEGPRVALWVEGSRKFRASTRGLRGMRYEGCQVLIFAEDLGAAGDQLMDQCTHTAKQVIEKDGLQVAVFEKNLEGDTWIVFILRPHSNVLLLATDEGYLDTVLARRDRRSGRRALPEDLPEWCEVDMSSRFWALRHYDPEDAAEDPTSPFVRRGRPTMYDPQAIGLAFSLAPANGAATTSARMAYLSSNPQAEHILESSWGLFSEIRKADEGVVEVLPRLEEERAASRCFFVLFMMLGHGVFL